MIPVPPNSPWPSLWSRIYWTVLPHWFHRIWYQARNPPMGRQPVWKDEA